MNAMNGLLERIKYFLVGCGIGGTAFLVVVLSGCKTAGTTAYTTISAIETAVTQANLAYLDSVVTGTSPTNSVPTVERVFNDTQMALRAAAAVASGGSSAAAPATLMVQATAFTNTLNSATGKVK